MKQHFKIIPVILLSNPGSLLIRPESDAIIACSVADASYNSDTSHRRGP